MSIGGGEKRRAVWAAMISNVRVRGSKGGNDRGGVPVKTYATIETFHTICLEYMHESAEHALRPIWRACLQANLPCVSASFPQCSGLE